MSEEEWQNEIRAYLRGPVYFTISDLQYCRDIVRAADRNEPVPGITSLDRKRQKAAAQRWINAMKAWAANPSRAKLPTIKGN